MLNGIEASYIPDMLVQYLHVTPALPRSCCNNQDIVLAPGYNYNMLGIDISHCRAIGAQ